MLRHLSHLSRRARSFCTAPPPSPTRQTAATIWQALEDTDWVDRETEDQDRIIEDAERHIDAYRTEYDPHAAEQGEGKETYEQMKNLYQMKEAAKIVSLYGDHIEHLIRDHEDMIGFLGNNVTVKEGDMDLAEQTLLEYSEFINVLEHKEIKRKVEHELGRKIVMFKMVVSAENFSTKFGSSAGGDFIPRSK